ncbi:unnamed protein product [Closterium sp. Naga37s-1]|nr:unnamed protein product [Closterium sp. Naga37s-1]
MIRVLPTWAAKAWNPLGTGPSQTLWRFLLLKVLMLLSHHSLLRGQSIREITLPDIFLYRLASTSSVNPENQPIGQFHGVRLIPPVDTSTRASWYKNHLFFAKNDTDQGELSVASHQHWARQLWDKNGVFCKRNVHAARARGAQELAIDGTPRAEIAELGHWALDKMTRAYITTIPVGVVMKKTGYSGYKQDYFLGRSRVEPSEKLLKLLAEHIFPGVDDMLKTAEGKAANGSDADKAAVHFWRTLQMLRRIVAEDLAVKLVRTPWHPYVQGSMLCRIPLFQHWAKWVERVDTETINKRRDPTQIQAESARLATLLNAEQARLDRFFVGFSGLVDHVKGLAEQVDDTEKYAAEQLRNATAAMSETITGNITGSFDEAWKAMKTFAEQASAWLEDFDNPEGRVAYARARAIYAMAEHVTGEVGEAKRGLELYITTQLSAA